MNFIKNEYLKKLHSFAINLVKNNETSIIKGVKNLAPVVVSDKDLQDAISKIINSVDLYSPSGIAGVICDELAKVEKRELKELRPVSALTLISAICRNRKGFNTKKLNLMFLASAETAYGKEAHQQFIKEILVLIGSENMMCTSPRSDRAFYIELAATGGSLYILDEAHSFFDCATSGKASAYQADMMKMILELNTSGLLLFPENIKRDILDGINARIKVLDKKSDLNSDEENELGYMKTVINRVKNGWPNPFVGFVGFSTPSNLNKIVSPKHIESGLLGRFIYLNSTDKSGELTYDPFADVRIETSISEQLIDRIKRISNSDDEISLSTDAQQILSLALKYLELDSVRNHPKLGGLYRRGVERISQISSLLAMETGVIDAEMASYAVAMFFTHVRVCEEALNGTSINHDEIILDRAHAVVLDVLKSSPQKKGLVANQLVRRCADIRKKRATHDKYEYVILNKLVEANNLVEKEGMYALSE